MLATAQLLPSPLALRVGPRPFSSSQHACISLCARPLTAARRCAPSDVLRPHAAAAAGAGEPSASSSGQPASEPAGNAREPTAAEPPAAKGPWAAIKRFFIGDKLDKQRLAALGMGAVASYGFLSNVVYGSGMAVTWILFVKQRGISPLAAWPSYLAFYAGFWAVNNFIRPFRFAIAVGMAPVFDRIIDSIAAATGWSRRNAFGAYLFLLGSSTCILVFGSITLFAGPAAYVR